MIHHKILFKRKKKVSFNNSYMSINFLGFLLGKGAMMMNLGCNSNPLNRRCRYIIMVCEIAWHSCLTFATEKASHLSNLLFAILTFMLGHFALLCFTQPHTTTISFSNSKPPYYIAIISSISHGN